MSVTIRDVARAAGVSTATAARALGGYGHASPAARRKVSESARQLGYRPNVVARALVSRATTTVGLVVGDIENPFFAAAARGLADVMDAHGYTVLLANADEDAGRERRAVDALRARQVDGMVVVPAPGASPEHLAELVTAGVPLVLLDRAVVGVAADSVLARNVAGARAAVAHLAGLGHRRIGVVSDSPEITSSAERIQGYRQALRAAGLAPGPGLISIGGPTRDDGKAAALRLLDRADRPTAVFTANNFMTVGALRAARSLGLRIPDDVALVGFDDLDWTTLVQPPVTVVRQPVADLGRVAGERLLRRLEGDAGPPKRIRLDANLIVRGSCGARA
ncbi:MAG TPA: LacI family DNA-binding transcriptional regulator [Gaiellales bacterium]|nr:LacI family DNA-binding transcriptional regulator [Gaiellales bacterium]